MLKPVFPMESLPMRPWYRWAVALFVFGLFLVQLGGRGLNEPDEGRYTSVGWDMATSGDFAVPRLNGMEHWSKPPLTYWLIAGSIRVFGANEFAARLPVALAGMGTVLAVYLIAASAAGEATGLVAAVMLALSAEFFASARLITTDMLLACFVAWSVWLFWRWVSSEQRSFGQLIWFYVFLAAAMMTKGPVGVVLPLFAVLAARWRHPTFRLREMNWGRGAAVFLALALPWFIIQAIRHEGLFHYFVFREVIGRVAENVHHRHKPVWFFLPVLAAGCWPWTPLLPWLGRRTARTAQDRAFGRLCGGWLGLGLALFTLSKSKMPLYAVPLLAPLALLLAWRLTDMLRDRDLTMTRRFRRSAMMTAILQLVVIVATLWIGRSRFNLPRTVPVVASVAAGVGAAAALIFAQRNQFGRAFVAYAGMAAVLVIGVVTVLPSVEQKLGHQGSAKFLAQAVRAADPTGTTPVIAYQKLLCGLPFYLGRHLLWYAPNSKSAGQGFEYDQHPPQPGGPMLSTGEFLAMVHGPHRVICLVRETALEKFSVTTGLYPHLIDRAGEWLVVSNQEPAP